MENGVEVVDFRFDAPLTIFSMPKALTSIRTYPALVSGSGTYL